MKFTKRTLVAAPIAVGLALAVAAPATADGKGKFGATQELTDGGVTIAYTLEELEPSDDTITNADVHGKLWEVSVDVAAVKGSVTPVIPFFNARAADGTNYRPLYWAVGPESLSGATLEQGQKSHGNIYLDVTGPAPTRVVYNDGVTDRMCWH